MSNTSNLMPDNGVTESTWINNTSQAVFAENDSMDLYKHNSIPTPTKIQQTNHSNYRYLTHRERHIVNGTETLYDIEEDDDYYTYNNNTYTTSVSIRVTPIENYYTSWGILFACFAVASCFALYQLLYKERMSKQQQQDGDHQQHHHSDVLSRDRSTRRSRRRNGTDRATMRHPDGDSSPDSHDRLPPHRFDSTQYEQYSAIDGDDSTNVISSADETRNMVCFLKRRWKAVESLLLSFVSDFVILHIQNSPPLQTNFCILVPTNIVTCHDVSDDNDANYDME
jgi:hypothetical protein